MAYERAWEPVEYAVFRKLDGNVIPGMPAKTLLLVGAALLVGLALFLATGLFTCQVEKTMGYEDLSTQRDHYTQMRAAVCCEDARAESTEKGTGEADYLLTSTLSGLTDQEVSELAREGRSLGMTSETTIAQATAMAPTTHLVSECAVPMVYRLVLALAPAVVIAALFFEMRGISLAREIENAMSWSRAQKTYFHR